MKKRILFILLIAGLIAPAGLMAQKISKVGSAIILDSTGGEAGGGLPTGAVTNVKKYTGSYGTPANSGSTLSNNTHLGTINAQVYEKLEIASADNGSATDWTAAFNGCKNTTPVGQWRLPTQRELMLIYIFRSAIVPLGGSTFAAGNYWVSTESTTYNAWFVSFGNGSTSNGAKTSNYRVRCVREL